MPDETKLAPAKKHSCPRCGYFDPYVQAFESAEARAALAAKAQKANTPEAEADIADEPEAKPTDDTPETQEPVAEDESVEKEGSAEKPTGLSSVVTVGEAA